MCGSGDPAEIVNPWLSVASYVTVALIWLIPDRRVERTLAAAPPET